MLLNSVDAPTSGNTGIMPPSSPAAPSSASVTWPPVPSTLNPAASSASTQTASPTYAPPVSTNEPPPTQVPGNILNNVSTSLYPSSPTGGIASNNDLTNSIGNDINTSANSLLPGGFNQGDLGVAPSQATPPSPQTYIDQAKANEVGPATWNVTPDQTVAGQYANLMNTPNEAIQAAEQKTIRNYSASGGRNDLMAQNAASMTGSQIALTIATQDAQTNAAAGEFNATQANAYNQALNQFTDNALLSKQNFDQGVAMLGAQTNEQLKMLTANVNATAATSSIQLNTALAQTKINLNATLATMDKQFGQNVTMAGVNAGIANAQSWTQYGQQIRLGYLSAVNQQQAALQSTIAAIQSNPNITQAQAAGAMSDAINQFNTFVSQLGAYSAAMMPTAAPGSTTYNSPAYAYNYIPAASWPNTGVAPNAGGSQAGNGFFLNPSALSGVAPSASPSSSTATGTPASVGGGNEQTMSQAQMDTHNQSESNFFMGNGGGFHLGNDGNLYAGSGTSGGGSTGSGESLGSVSEAADSLESAIGNGAQAITTWANNHKLLAAAAGLLIPGGGIVMLVAKALAKWLSKKKSATTTPTNQSKVQQRMEARGERQSNMGTPEAGKDFGKDKEVDYMSESQEMGWDPNGRVVVGPSHWAS